MNAISAEYDLQYLQAALIDLEGYLLSDEQYWPIGASSPAGSPAFPRLTLGSILLSQARLHARTLTPQQQAGLTKLEQKMDATKKQWRAAWGRKAARGVHSRLNLWDGFLEDYRQAPDANTDRYDYEVRRRVMLDLLLPEADGVPPAEIEMLKSLDAVVRASLVPGPFLWEPELQGGFPQDRYWYLYGYLKRSKE